jgi:GWxTD domain-containing protein
MNVRGSVFISALLTAALLVPPGAVFAEQQQPSRRDQRRQERELRKEIGPIYREWLDNEVGYIISDEERQAFLRLSTNEEREQFIEQFWLRRDPTPDTVENETREEHYRRIAYANERFASGIPGWKTDRGRIYIIWGPPDEIESHAGGSYNRPYEEGGGYTSVFPFEKWRYRYMPGIGTNIIIEFVDPSGSGEFRMTMDPSEKDALLMVPGAGLSDMESMGMASKVDRFTRSDGTRLPKTMGGDPMYLNQFERLSQFAAVQRPPEVKFRDLEEVVRSRIVRNQIDFDYRFDFLRVTSESVLVPITIQVSNKQLTYNYNSGIHNAALNIFGRITTIGGRVVQTFEDVVTRDFPDSLFEQSLQGSSIYQKTLPLRPGLYRLDLVIKDVHSGNVGADNKRLAVPRFSEDSLATSTLILADLIERVPTRQVGLGQFVLGASKVRPRLDRTFTAGDRMGVYLQVYNLSLDEESKRSSVTVTYRVRSGEAEVFSLTESSADPDFAAQPGSQITIEKTLALAGINPGKYTLDIIVTDRTNGSSVTSSADFTVNAAETRAAAARRN